MVASWRGRELGSRGTSSVERRYQATQWKPSLIALVCLWSAMSRHQLYIKMSNKFDYKSKFVCSQTYHVQTGYVGSEHLLVITKNSFLGFEENQTFRTKILLPFQGQRGRRTFPDVLLLCSLFLPDDGVSTLLRNTRIYPKYAALQPTTPHSPASAVSLTQLKNSSYHSWICCGLLSRSWWSRCSVVDWGTALQTGKMSVRFPKWWMDF
jgi:hypothetical protein